MPGNLKLLKVTSGGMDTWFSQDDILSVIYIGHPPLAAASTIVQLSGYYFEVSGSPEDVAGRLPIKLVPLTITGSSPKEYVWINPDCVFYSYSRSSGGYLVNMSVGSQLNGMINDSTAGCFGYPVDDDVTKLARLDSAEFSHAYTARAVSVIPKDAVVVAYNAGPPPLTSINSSKGSSVAVAEPIQFVASVIGKSTVF